MLVVVYIYVNDYKNDYKPNYKNNYKLQCIIPSQYLYVNDYKHDYNPKYKPNYKLRVFFHHNTAKVGKTSWVPVMLCQRWYNMPHRSIVHHKATFYNLQSDMKQLLRQLVKIPDSGKPQLC